MSSPKQSEKNCFGDRLVLACHDKNSAVCVGLDPRWESLPLAITRGVDHQNLVAVAGATQCYCQEVIDAIKPHCAVVKPQAAFFELMGPAGMQALYGVIQHARKSGLLVLLDGKRGDIGSTAEGYAGAYLGEESPWACDALTVNPYLGEDTLQPFVRRATKTGSGIFVLVKTSNLGSGFLQDRTSDDQPIYRHVAKEVESIAAESAGRFGLGSVGAVVGATYPEQLIELREELTHAWLLIPGFGAQGGTADQVRPGFLELELDGTHFRSGAIVNSSRGIIFAYKQRQFEGLQWQDAVSKAAEEMKQQLNS